MKRLLTRLAAVPLAWLVCAASVGRADTAYYQTFASNNEGTSNILWAEIQPGHPRGGLELLAPKYGTINGNQEVVLANLRPFSCAPSDHPERFVNAGYRLSMTVLDLASNTFGTVHFAGVFNGTMAYNATDIANAWVGETAQTLRLGKNLYSISLANYIPPGSPANEILGAITAYVSVITSDAPEPSTLALGGLGCAALGLASWRKRRQLV